jgi:actin-related protein 5
MVRETAYFSYDYPTELETLSDPEKMSEIDKVVQFDYALPEVNLKTDEEIAKSTERRREQGRKLQEMAAKQRAEKVCVGVWPYIISNAWLISVCLL